MEENNSYTSAMADFAVVEDGHDGQTEEDKREAYAAEDAKGRDPGPKGEPGEPGVPTAGKDPEPEKKEPAPPAEKKPAMDQAAIDAYIAQGRTQGETSTRQKFEEDFAGARVINPTTGKPFASMEEYQAYGKEQLLQRQRQEARDTKRKGQSEDDRLKEIQERDRYVELGRAAEARQNKEAAEKQRKEQNDAATAEAQRKLNAFLVQDGRAFMAKYPDVDIGDLEKNEDFREFCDDRYADGKHSLVKLYEQYLKLTGNAGRAASLSRESKDSRSTSGSRNGGGSTLTAAEKAELEEWNRTYPHMKMTESEFASRG